uniref:Uncharacterized protein n=1 Tax=Anguilla anguilla TaxID=7936 RepID=A0A0E9VDP4_ANGAN
MGHTHVLTQKETAILRLNVSLLWHIVFYRKGKCLKLCLNGEQTRDTSGDII